MDSIVPFILGVAMTIVILGWVGSKEVSEDIISTEKEKSWLCTEETDGVSVCTTPDTEFEVLRRYKRNEYVL